MDHFYNDVKNKNGGYSVGTLHGRPMERLAFYYHRHVEIIRYIRMRHIYYHPMVMHVFCLLPLKVFVWFFVIPDAIEYNLILNMFHKICILHPKLSRLVPF